MSSVRNNSSSSSVMDATTSATPPGACENIPDSPKQRVFSPRIQQEHTVTDMIKAKSGDFLAISLPQVAPLADNGRGPRLSRTPSSVFSSLRLKSFSTSLSLVTLALLVSFCGAVRYAGSGDKSDARVDQYYMYLVDVNVMIFVGFGFLMTFLRRYSYSAVALNYLMACIAMLEFVVVGGSVQQMLPSEAKHSPYIQLTLPLLIDSSFCAASAMIAFGAVLGKVSPTRLLWLILIMVPIYALNQHLVYKTFKALDVGGSISIHVFGAYYGLAASMVASPPKSGAAHKSNNASYTSDITAMIGTLFLFIYWPSFNGALASNPMVDGSLEVPLLPQTQFYCIVNTILSLLAATLTAFLMSAALEGKLDMVHIQNATLAGGVAMGSAANMIIQPGGAVGLGIAAGAVSTLGYVFLQPLLEKKIGLKDTCGVHNLHGMPGILGGLAAAIASEAAFTANEPLLGNGTKQFGYQIAAIVSTVAIAAVSGLLAGLLVTRVNLFGDQDLPDEALFEDAPFWVKVEAEKSGLLAP